MPDIKFFAIPFCDGETATMYFFHERLMAADPDQTNITMDQLKHIYDSNEVKMNPDWTFDQLVANVMNFDVMADGVEVGDFTYGFTHMAILPIEKADEVHNFSSAMWEMCGDDSSTYNACDAFNRFIKSHAVKVIELSNNCEIVER